jgi:hypothetical protein
VYVSDPEVDFAKFGKLFNSGVKSNKIQIFILSEALKAAPGRVGVGDSY